MREFETQINTVRYEEVAQYVIEHIDAYLPERYKGAASSMPVPKPNGVVLHGIQLKPVGETGFACVPVLYLENVDFSYSLDEITENLAHTLVTACEEKAPAVDLAANLSREYILENSKLFVLNKENNQLDISHEWEDLLVGVKCVLHMDDGVGTFTVTKGVFEKYGITEAELFNAAERNTVANARIEEMFAHLEGHMFVADEEPMNLMDMSDDEIRELKASVNGAAMLLVYGRDKFYAASSILCPEVQEKLSVFYGEDGYYVIPSSIHEVITVASDIDADELFGMVSEVNATQVAEVEVLSYNVYRYTKEKGLHIAER